MILRTTTMKKNILPQNVENVKKMLLLVNGGLKPTQPQLQVLLTPPAYLLLLLSVTSLNKPPILWEYNDVAFGPTSRSSVSYDFETIWFLDTGSTKHMCLVVSGFMLISHY